MKNGSYDTANEVRNVRLGLVFGDCSELVNSLNAKLRELGEDTVSRLGSPSILPGLFKPPPISNQLHSPPNIPQDTVHDHIQENSPRHPPPSPTPSHMSSRLESSSSDHEIFVRSPIDETHQSHFRPNDVKQPSPHQLPDTVNEMPHPMHTEKLDPTTR